MDSPPQERDEPPGVAFESNFWGFIIRENRSGISDGSITPTILILVIIAFGYSTFASSCSVDESPLRATNHFVTNRFATYRFFAYSEPTKVSL